MPEEACMLKVVSITIDRVKSRSDIEVLEDLCTYLSQRGSVHRAS